MTWVGYGTADGKRPPSWAPERTSHIVRIGGPFRLDEMMESSGRARFVWTILVRHGRELSGEVRWSRAFRRYVLMATRRALFPPEALEEIVKFCAAASAWQRANAVCRCGHVKSLHERSVDYRRYSGRCVICSRAARGIGQTAIRPVTGTAPRGRWLCEKFERMR